MANLWFRLHHEILDDPRVQKLDGDSFKTYINLLCFASKRSKDGDIGTLEDVSFALRETNEVLQKRFIALHEAELIVSFGTGNETFQIPQWKKKQYKSDTSTERVRRHRNAKKSVTVTTPDTDTDTDTDNSTAPKGAPACPIKKIADLYNETVKFMPKWRVLSDDTKRNISMRWKQHEKFQSIKKWKDLFDYCDSNAFLSGQADNPRPFKADLNWIVKSANFAKILNGKYDNS